MVDQNRQIIEDVAELKGEVRFIVKTLQQVQLDTKQVLNKFSDKIDEMAKYHQEIGGYIKIAADNSKRINSQDVKIERVKKELDTRIDKLEKWKVAILGGATVIGFLLGYNMITFSSLF